MDFIGWAKGQTQKTPGAKEILERQRYEYMKLQKTSAEKYLAED